MNDYLVTVTFRTNPLSRDEHDPEAVSVMHTFTAPSISHVFTLIINQYPASLDHIINVTIIDATPNRWS
jgi:hypothetical protein